MDDTWKKQRIELARSWWADPRWHTFARSLKLTPHQVDAHFAWLREAYPDDWVQEQFAATLGLREHNAMNAVVERLTGAHALAYLEANIHLAEMLEDLAAVPGFTSVYQASRDTKKSRAALMEMSTAHLFQKASFGVRFPRAGNEKKSFDVLVEGGGQAVAVECKYVEYESFELVGDMLRRMIPIVVIGYAATHGVQFRFRVSERVTDIFGDHRKPEARDVNFTLAKRFTDVLCAEMKKSATGKLPAYRNLFGLIEWRAFEEGTEETESFLGSMGSQLAKMRTLMTKFASAVPQLPQDMPGIVFADIEAHRDSLPPEDEAQGVFDMMLSSRFGELPHVTALVVFPASALAEPPRPLLLTNPRARVRWEQLELRRAMPSFTDRKTAPPA